MALGAIVGIMVQALPTGASAATVITVELWDKGGTMDMSADRMYGTPNIDMSKATMGVKVSQASAPAGVVSFKVTNTSKDTVHEMVLFYLADPSKPLPYKADETKVDEDKAGYKGEVEELDPGKSGTLTAALQPGKYLLACNMPGHFAAGMWIEFEVTK
jgi:uncharacterized cupredoxin-like copper-binding protein